MSLSRARAALAAILALTALTGGISTTLPAAGQTADPTPSGDAVRGKAAFVAHGCDECHGSLGQGNRGFGVRLAPHPIPYAAVVRQLRSPRSVMPPYSAKVLSDRDAADIYAYLASIPSGKPAASIPILAAIGNGNAGPVTTVSSGLSHGATIFAQRCASCHGTGGSGGFGPALVGERSRKDLRSAVAFIKNPVAPMPKLYPATLSDRDVADVAAYVESL
ncbi:MAG TPA: c-type cytochrome [Candidatus Acidoferrum sp.]|nr:c-type cytochrome [Candidatus Acidoferrum sp.]